MFLMTDGGPKLSLVAMERLDGVVDARDKPPK